MQPSKQHQHILLLVRLPIADTLRGEGLGGGRGSKKKHKNLGSPKGKTLEQLYELGLFVDVCFTPGNMVI